MDNFKSHKRQKRSSVDGFVVSGQGNRGLGDLSGFNQYYKPTRPTIPDMPLAARGADSFQKRTEGFTPAARQSMPAMRAATHQEGYADFADEKPEKLHEDQPKIKKAKRSLFRRKKSKDKHAKHEKRSKKKVILRSAAAFGVFILLIGGGLLLRGYLTSRGIFKGGGNSAFLNNGDVDPSQLNGEGDGRVNILLLGKGGQEQPDGPDLTDTIIVASIDPLAKEAALLSIPRDLWVKSPSGGQTKINQVYYDAKQAALNKYPYKERGSDAAKQSGEEAGIAAMKKTVSDSMGVPIHYYAMIDFAGFRKAIDSVGGIDINVTEEMAVSEQLWLAGKGNYKLDVKPGYQHFDGWKALAFSRSRKTSSKGDFARAERQRAVIVGLKDKVLSVGTLANPVKLNQLMSDFSGNLATDFSINEMLRLYDLSKEISSDKVTSAGLDEYVRGDTINNLSVQVPKEGMFNYTAIQAYVRNIMRDAFIKKEDAKIVILNGTPTAGLATKKSTELKSFGYNITSIGDAPTENYTKTVLVSLRGDDKKYTKNYLEKRLGVTATGSLPDSNIQAGDADFVIILGTDAAQ